MSMDHSNAILICSGNISLALNENSVVTKVIAIYNYKIEEHCRLPTDRQTLPFIIKDMK